MMHLRLDGQTAPILMLPGHDRLLYDPATTEAEIREAVESLRAQTGPRPWYLAFWANNNLGKCGLMSWDDDDGWNVFRWHLGVLKQAALANSCRGVLTDLELYLYTPHMDGGLMDKRRAWQDHPRIPERARQYADALSGLTLGGYVATGELARLKGLKRWVKCLAELGPYLLLAEDYTGHNDREAAKRTGARVIPGKQGGAEVLERRQRDGWSWGG
ncbi:MAG TPA: hypothetical protein VFU47_03010 [Armatimonadota bacterium]|nr:hypothetical protein [Armatimonadota bacterium]